ncbi:MAG: 4-hydroxy-tetrahydrodipicolinate reductase [Propionibacteriaceae bacterium]|jgi:4-hydroxy-tetrahydrodipicolinate reductase|nr:4-hydroxy-tetrahydrodipicolinate reductase [Propionibacteriaceae bacterium]
MRIAVFGVLGRMGQEVCRAVTAADDLELVAGVDIGDSKEVARSAQVIVDFTHPDSVMDNIDWCLEHDIHVVVGTTGFTAERLEQVRRRAAAKPAVSVVIAANYSIGAVLMMHFAKLAAPHFDSVEIVELHHAQKIDAPSGTARQTAEVVAAARRRAGRPAMPDATTHAEPGARGADIAGVRVHSLRLAGLLASQEVHFTSVGETLVVRDDARDRSSFMPGVLAAVRWAPQHPGLTVGLEAILGL